MKSFPIALIPGAILFITIITLASSPATAATIYNDGLVHVINTDLNDEVIVSDSGGGGQTTVNYVTGGASEGLTVNDNSMVSLSGNATITTGGFDTLNNSEISISDSAEINGAVTVNDNSTVNWSGGSFDANTALDMSDSSMTTITGGTFTCNQNSGGCLRVFNTASLIVDDVVVDGGLTSVFARGDSAGAPILPHVTINGGTFNSTDGLRTQNAIMDILGGDFDKVNSVGNNSTITIFGSNFVTRCDNAVGDCTGANDILFSGFGTIDGFTFTGSITGTLSDGALLDIAAFVTGTGSTTTRIILAPVPVPAALWLFSSALGLLGWMRRKKA